MKKLFSSLLAFATAAVLTTSASAEWSLVGDFQDWQPASGLRMVETDAGSNIFVVTCDHLTTGFKVVENGSWDFNYGAGSDFSVIPGKPVAIVEDGTNFTYANNIAAINNAKVTLDLVAETLTVEGTDIEYASAEIEYSIVGSFNGWGLKDSECNFTAEKNGIYKLNLPASFVNESNIEFKVVANHSWQPINWGADEKLEFNKALVLDGSGNSGNIKLGDVTLSSDYYFLLDTTGDAFVLVLTDGTYVPETPDPVDPTPGDYSDWYVNFVGPFNNWQDNGVHPGADNIAVITLENVNSNFKVKVYDGEDHYYTTVGGELAVNEWVKLDANEDTMVLPVAYQTGTVVMRFNVVTNQLFVSVEGVEPTPTPDPDPVDYSEWYVNVVGDFNNWEDNGVHPGEDNISVTVLEDVNTIFKIKVYDGAEDHWYTNAGGELVANEWVKLDSNVDDMTLPKALQSGKVVVRFNVATNEICVSAEGEEPIPTPGNYPAKFYVIGDLEGSEWAPGAGIEAEGVNGVYTWNIKVVNNGYFAFVELNSSEWDGEGGINSGLRYGPNEENAPFAANDVLTVDLNWNSFKAEPGEYKVILDLTNCTASLLANTETGVAGVEAAALCGDVYNVAGVRVLRGADNAAVKALPAGLYIVGGKKVLVK